MSKHSILAIVSLLAAATVAHAADIVVPGDAADTYIGLNLDSDIVVAWAGDASLMTGDDNAQSSKDATAGIAIFVLPELGGAPILDARLDFTITGSHWMSSTSNLDVYGLRSSSSSTVLTTDYGFGPNPGNGTLIQDNIFDNFGGNTLDFPIPVSTDSTGSANLVSWLDGLYQGGAVAGDYAFIRLNLDSPSANPATIASANNANAAYHPALIVTVPEPSTYAAIFGFGALGFAILRRR